MTLLLFDHMGMGGFFLFPFFAFVFGLLWVVLLLWVVYDVATRSDMWVGEKVLWVAVALLFNVLGPVLYLVVVYMRGEPVFPASGPSGVGLGGGDVRELERLADLRDRGAITEEEYEELKRERLDRFRGRD